MNPAERFIEKTLPVKPKSWFLGGSRANGTHRPDSDWDIYALYESERDIPYEWLFNNQNDEGLFVVSGDKVDFHYFAEDWKIYRRNPHLLEIWEA